MISVAVLTVSDSSHQGLRTDTSGPALSKRCQELGWSVVAAEVIPDEEKAIARQIAAWADNATAAVILTTGGTGVSTRDVTPEATRTILDREIPGIAELIRSRGLEQTKFAILSRGLAGTRKQSFILNLPGSPKGAIHSLEIVKDVVPHILDLLAGRTGHPVSAQCETGDHNP